MEGASDAGCMPVIMIMNAPTTEKMDRKWRGSNMLLLLVFCLTALTWASPVPEKDTLPEGKSHAQQAVPGSPPENANINFKSEDKNEPEATSTESLTVEEKTDEPEDEPQLLQSFGNLTEADLDQILGTPQKPGGQKSCTSRGCVTTAAMLIENGDFKADPCQDFYQFACGGFEQKNIIPDHESTVSAFSKVEDNLNAKLRVVMDSKAKPEEPKVFHRVRDLYAQCMNMTAIKAEGEGPLVDIITSLGGWPVVQGENWTDDSFDWIKRIARHLELGLGTSYLIDFSISVDGFNTTRHTIEIDQPGLGMPGRSYLMKGINDTLVQAYLKLMVDIAVLVGANREQALTELRDAVQFEIELANYTLPMEERRNFTQLYNKMTLRELQDKVPNVNWVDYANNLLPDNITESEVIVVSSIKFLQNLFKLIDKTPKRTLANYLTWRGIVSMIGALDPRFRSAWIKYSSSITGQSVDSPRWKICLSTVRNSFGSAVGSLYVRKYFNEDSKKMADEMVKDIFKEFRSIVTDVDWMDETTRKRALGKLNAMGQVIAYPPELLDDSKLDEYYENATLSPKGFFASILHLKKVWLDYRASQLRKPYIRNNWKDWGSVAVVNAYYTSVQNLIIFPAGILQGVFFGNDRPKYVNYAAIGFIMGHEITHGFDDQGRQFDADGNLKLWWEPSTDEHFKSKAKCIIGQYSNYTVPENGMKVNGINTQGENIADNGGLKEAYKAYMMWVERNGEELPLPGLTLNQKQLFWLSNANVWCSKNRPEALALRILSGVHSPSRFRVNGALANQRQFSEDYNCPVGTAMNPVDRCEVW